MRRSEGRHSDGCNSSEEGRQASLAVTRFFAFVPLQHIYNLLWCQESSTFKADAVSVTSESGHTDDTITTGKLIQLSYISTHKAYVPVLRCASEFLHQLFEGGGVLIPWLLSASNIHTKTQIVVSSVTVLFPFG